MSRLPPSALPAVTTKVRVAAWNLFTLLPFPFESKPGSSALRDTAPHAAATIIIGMRSRRIGRALGIGVRIAGRIAGQRLAAQPQPAGSALPPRPAAANDAVNRTVLSSATQVRAAGQTVRQSATQAQRGVRQGVGGFFRPFRRVGGILWLEVTGVFFLLPVIVFAPTLWREAMAYSHTSDHRTFWITAIIDVVFLYLGISSFWRARRRSSQP